MKIGVGVMLMKSGKVLMGKRSPTSNGAFDGANTYNFPGGKWEPGEDLITTAYRETKEETGVEINKHQLELISLSEDIYKDSRFLTIGFLAKDFTGEPRATEPEETPQWGWYSLDDLPKPLFIPTENLIENYKKRRIYKNSI